jgi:hypothetical protein
VHFTLRCKAVPLQKGWWGYHPFMTTYNGGAHEVRRANPIGAYVTTAGTLIVLASVWLNWVTLGRGDETSNASSGYEADSIVPWAAFFGVSLAVALLYATKRADRRQHRGLSLTSMAAGLATLLFTIAFVIDPIATRQYSPDNNISVEFGVFVAMFGALLWAIGSFMLAKEPEGDAEDTAVVRATTARPVTTTATSGTSDVHSHNGGTHVGSSAAFDDSSARSVTAADDLGRTGTAGATGSRSL